VVALGAAQRVLEVFHLVDDVGQCLRDGGRLDGIQRPDRLVADQLGQGALDGAQRAGRGLGAKPQLTVIGRKCVPGLSAWE
jgi:hypothetical protein